MDWIEELNNQKQAQKILFPFLEKYGFEGLEEALKEYDQIQQLYICRTKTSTHKIRIDDIYYIDIKGHNIAIHTANQIYTKYGTLNDELEILSGYGFLKCSRNCIVPLGKIKSIHQYKIILQNNEKLHMSQKYSWQILSAIAFAKKRQ